MSDIFIGFIFAWQIIFVCVFYLISYSLYLMLFLFLKILIRLSKLCVQNKKCRNQHQRLLKNMGAHSVVLDLLKIPYEKVSGW